jgi:hypothetical protein
VRTLLEMAADDQAIRVSNAHTFVRALCKLAGETDASTSCGSEPAVVTRRAERAFGPPRGGRLIAVGSGLSSLGVLALPVVAICLASGGR